MRRAAFAGFLYFALAFAAGFALGVVRTLFLAPSIGATAAVALELPFMLAISWLAAGFVAQRQRIGSEIRPRLFMGAVAFSFLMMAEFALSQFVFGANPMQQFDRWRTPEGALGLAGQMAFAAIPALQSLLRRGG